MRIRNFEKFKFLQERGRARVVEAELKDSTAGAGEAVSPAGGTTLKKCFTNIESTIIHPLFFAKYFSSTTNHPLFFINYNTPTVCHQLLLINFYSSAIIQQLLFINYSASTVICQFFHQLLFFN